MSPELVQSLGKSVEASEGQGIIKKSVPGSSSEGTMLMILTKDQNKH